MEIEFLNSNKQKFIDGPLLLRPHIFEDERGYFFESWNKNLFNESVGKEISFVQDNHSCSKKGTIRGMHFQATPYQQSKLVRCIYGSIFDVIVDIRQTSKSFGEWFGIEMNASNNYQLWIPPGFAHGFLALSQDSIVLYKVDKFRNQNYERILKWNDTLVAIKWPQLKEPYHLSEKDKNAPNLTEIYEDDLF
tara:strand:+ start:1677 stop:2252 length:576 start_codon:yes stop_codon:yes gene_type:complete